MKTRSEALISMAVVIALCLFAYKELWALSGGCEQAETSAEMRACANRRYEDADAALNRFYQRLMSQLPTQRREQLKAAQRAWIDFRDKNAAFVAGAAEDGTLYPILEVSELATMTKQRVDQLKAHIVE